MAKLGRYDMDDKIERSTISGEDWKYDVKQIAHALWSEGWEFECALMNKMADDVDKLKIVVLALSKAVDDGRISARLLADMLKMPMDDISDTFVLCGENSIDL